MPRGTVNSRLRRALDQLAVELGEGAMTRGLERRLRASWRSAPPRAEEAERRAWDVVDAAYAGAAGPSGGASRPPDRGRGRGGRVAVGLVSPRPGRSRRLDRDVVSPAPTPRTGAVALPARGRLLVAGTGAVGRAGRRRARRLRGSADATWSPGGLYVAAARGRSW